MGGAVGAPRARRFLIVAGEASGDRHAARLVRALRTLGPCEVFGAAGPAMVAEGVEAIVPAETLAVIGFTGVLARLPRILRALGTLGRAARARHADVAVLVDSPGFNFRLGPALRRAGVPVFYYIAPQVWAWHAERARAMAAWVNRLAVVFPFEEPLFRAAGVDARFVGHPLLEGLEPETDAATFRREIGAPDGARLLGLLPGSRRQEVALVLPILAEAAGRLTRGRPDLVAVVPVAPGLDPEWVASRLPLGTPVRLVAGRAHAVQAYATACAVASGTATLETALFGTPHVIVFRTGRLNFAIARRVVRLERIGLSNIVAGEAVAPELLQDALTPDALAALLAPWLDDPALRAAQQVRLACVRERLGGAGASQRTAEWLWSMTA